MRYSHPLSTIAHLILAHENPGQLARLVDKISHPTANIYIHLDLHTPIRPFLETLSHHTGVTFIKNRKRVNWGAFSMVEATLQSLREISAKDKKFSHINILSGSDYPLQHPAAIHRFLTSRPNTSFMEYHRADSRWWIEAQPRFKKFHFEDYSFSGKYALQKIANLIPIRRKMPFGMELVGRSQWFTMARPHLEYVLKFEHDHPTYSRFFKYTWGPDEFFFQTILFNSPFRNEIVNDNLRYINWKKKMVSPRILTGDDFPQLIQSDKLYARKFDTHTDSSILDMLDARLGAP